MKFIMKKKTSCLLSNISKRTVGPIVAYFLLVILISQRYLPNYIHLPIYMSTLVLPSGDKIQSTILQTLSNHNVTNMFSKLPCNLKYDATPSDDQ